MWQEIIVYLIGTWIVIYFSRKGYLYFCRKKNRDNRCDDCPGCVLHPKNNTGKSKG